MGKFGQQQQQSNNVTNIAGSNDDSWKATGFLNLSLPWSDGTNKKIGAIALKDSKVTDKMLIDLIEKDPAAAMAMIKEHLIISYQSAVAVVPAGAGFKFG